MCSIPFPSVLLMREITMRLKECVFIVMAVKWIKNTPIPSAYVYAAVNGISSKFIASGNKTDADTPETGTSHSLV